MDRRDFRQLVYDYYQNHGRAMPWRTVDSHGFANPYHILVSELMLQQTQVKRVTPKFNAFILNFPTMAALAGAPLSEVLELWSGLGYNRRAKYLHQAAKQLPESGRWTVSDLENCKGIGPNTAAAICVYSYNQPLVFIETNIRTVFIHHFFPGRESVSDAELAPLVQDMLDTKNPREWYWALMDYGVYLKKTDAKTAARRSAHFTKQSRFDGSRRQIRGAVIRELTAGPLSFQQLSRRVADGRLKSVLAQLADEKMIVSDSTGYRLAT